MKKPGEAPFDIYRYTDTREVVLALYERKRRANPRYSLRAWTRQLGFKNPSLVSQICKGERRLSLQIAQRIAESAAFEEGERRYLELLVLREKAKLPQERALYEDLLRAQLPDTRAQVFPVDRFRMIADWHHLALLEMIGLKGAGAEPEWFARRLGGKVTADTVAVALERLKRLGLIEREPNGQWKRTQAEVLAIEPAALNLAVQSHHEQMLARAQEALRELPLEQRGFRSTTLSVRAQSLPRIRELISEFHRAVLALAVEEGGDETLQLNTQFFQLTQKFPEEMKS